MRRFAGLFVALVCGFIALGVDAASTPDGGVPAEAGTAADAGPLWTPPDAGILTYGSVLQRARAEIESAITDSDPTIRGEGYGALAIAQVPDAPERLDEAMQDLNGQVRFGAARGLRFLAAPSTRATIVRSFRQEEEGWAVLRELAGAAAAVGAKELIPDLRKAGEHPRPELAAAAAFALMDLGDTAHAKAILTKLKNPKRKDPRKDGEDRWSRKVLTGKKDGDVHLAARTLAEIGNAKDDVIYAQQFSTSQNRMVRVWSASGMLRYAPPGLKTTYAVPPELVLRRLEKARKEREARDGGMGAPKR